MNRSFFLVILADCMRFKIDCTSGLYVAGNETLWVDKLIDLLIG